MASSPAFVSAQDFFRGPSTKLLVGQTYFLTSIKTIIIGGRFDPLALATQRGHQYAFGDQQMVIDAISQMRQICQ